MELNSNHFFLTSSQDIQELMKPLRKHFGITTFIYKKNFNDGSDVRLSNRAEVTDDFYQGKFYTESLFEARPSLYKKGRVLLDNVYDKDSCAVRNSRKHDMDYSIIFIEPFADGCEFFGFGVPVGRIDLMHRYLSHIDLLEKFILYFRESAKSLIRQAEQSKIFIPEKFELAPIKLIDNKEVFFDRNSFLYEVSHKIQKIFSIREMQCAELLIQGHTAKMIAQQLNLSHRTIETYIENIKQKTRSFKKSDLIQALSIYFE